MAIVFKCTKVSKESTETNQSETVFFSIDQETHPARPEAGAPFGVHFHGAQTLGLHISDPKDMGSYEVGKKYTLIRDIVEVVQEAEQATPEQTVAPAPVTTPATPAAIAGDGGDAASTDDTVATEATTTPETTTASESAAFDMGTGTA